jgi:putative DNA primase/helicase
MLTPNLEKIPAELKAIPQWVVWRLEDREGKPTKIPYNPASPKQKAKADVPHTWANFETAVKVSKSDGFNGVGYEFSKSCPYAGVDLDHCRNPVTGEIEAWAEEIISKLNSYAEISPSGEGVHILVKGKLRTGARRRKGKVEMYDHGRYFTVTGHPLEGTPTTIEDRESELEGLHGKIFGKPSEKINQGQSRSTKSEKKTEESDKELIDRISKSRNGNKFNDLWRGDIEYLTNNYPYPSASEADLALCSILAFWTGKDAERIDRLFRRSGLMRAKWDEYRGDRTYSEITIAEAIAGTTEVIGGSKKKRPKNKKHNKTNKKDTSQGIVIIDDLNKKHAVVMVGGKCAIMNEVTDPVSGRPDVTFSSIFDFKNYYSNKNIVIINEDGTQSKIAVTKLWLESPLRRTFEGIAFTPGQDISGFYNLFRGFAVAPARGDWSLLQEHIFHIICGGNAELFEYLMQWMARNVQDPGGERPGVAIVLKSPERGTGKGVFVTQYGKIFGNHFKT